MKQRWVERHEYVVTTWSAAPPDAVYDVLADLSTHIDWSGRQLGDRAERLLSIDAPPGLARVDMEFSSTGYTPVGTFHDRSRITTAERPSRLEYVTQSELELTSGRAMASVFANRFLIEPVGSSSRITRSVSQPSYYAPAPWWAHIFGWPPIALLAYWLMARSTAMATLRNLALLAEERARAGVTPAANDSPPAGSALPGITGR